MRHPGGRICNGAAATMALAGALLALGLAGCAASGSVRRLEDDSRGSQARIAELTQANDELRRELAALRAQVDASRRELEQAVRDGEARQREEIDGLGKRVGATEKRLEALGGAIRGVEMSVGGLADQVARLEAVSTTGAGPATRREPRGKPAARPSGAGLAAADLFTRGAESFKNGELAQAILDFEDFLARNPSHAQAGTAQFLIAEAYYNARDYQHATVEYRKAAELAPKGDKAPEALFKLGLAHRALKRPDRAREVWTQLVQEYPQTDAAQRARLALRDTVRGGTKAGALADR